MMPPNEARHRMSSNNLNLEFEDRGMPGHAAHRCALPFGGATQIMKHIVELLIFGFLISTSAAELRA